MKSKFSNKMLDDTITSLMAHLLRAETVEFRITNGDDDVLLFSSPVTLKLDTENRRITFKYTKPPWRVLIPFPGTIYHNVMDENGNTMISTIDMEHAYNGTLSFLNNSFDVTLASA